MTIGPHSEAHSRRDIEAGAPDVPELSLVHDSLFNPVWPGCNCVHSVLH